MSDNMLIADSLLIWVCWQFPENALFIAYRTVGLLHVCFMMHVAWLNNDVNVNATTKLAKNMTRTETARTNEIHR